MNTIIEIEKLLDNITSAAMLEKIKEYANNRIADNYDLIENFMFHDKIDSYIYEIKYNDGNKYVDYIGKRAYDKYMNDDNAISIYRKTKDLFPTYELLLQK